MPRCKGRSPWASALYKTERNEEGVKMYTWSAVRRQNLRNLRRQTKAILLLMALLEAIRLGPVELVRQGQDGYPLLTPENYGISYNLGYFLSWLYMCVFMVIFVPLFGWWLPRLISTPTEPSSSDDSPTSSTATKLSSLLTQLNLILLPLTIAICLVQHIYYTLYTFIYVDSRPVKSHFALPANTRRNWLARLSMLAGVLLSLACGRGAFAILADMGLARVKCLEYCVIVVPMQVNLGVMLGSLVQWRVERRGEMKRIAMKRVDAEVGGDEKTGLLVEN